MYSPECVTPTRAVNDGRSNSFHLNHVQLCSVGTAGKSAPSRFTLNRTGRHSDRMSTRSGSGLRMLIFNSFAKGSFKIFPSSGLLRIWIVTNTGWHPVHEEDTSHRLITDNTYWEKSSNLIRMFLIGQKQWFYSLNLSLAEQVLMNVFLHVW